MVGQVETMPPAPPFDAATLILVLHFVKGDAARAALLGAIAARLKPGAPLLLTSLYREGNAGAALGAWKTLQVLSGLPREAVEERMRRFWPKRSPSTMSALRACSTRPVSARRRVISRVS